MDKPGSREEEKHASHHSVHGFMSSMPFYWDERTTNVVYFLVGLVLLALSI